MNVGNDPNDGDEYLTPFDTQSKSSWIHSQGSALRRLIRDTATRPRYTAYTYPTDRDEPRKRQVDYQQIDATTSRVLGTYASGALYGASEEFTKREGRVPVRDEQPPLVIRGDFGGPVCRDVYARIAASSLVDFTNRINALHRELEVYNNYVLSWGPYMAHMTSEEEMERVVREQTRRSRAIQLGHPGHMFTRADASDPIVGIDFGSYASEFKRPPSEDQLIDSVVLHTVQSLKAYGHKAFQIEYELATHEAAMIESYKVARALLPMQRAESDMRGTHYVEYLDYLTGDVNIRQKLYDRALHHYTRGSPRVRQEVLAAVFNQDQRERDDLWNESVEPGADLDDDPMSTRYKIAEESSAAALDLSREIADEIAQRFHGWRGTDSIVPYFMSFAVFPSDLKWHQRARHVFEGTPGLMALTIADPPDGQEEHDVQERIREAQEMRRTYYARYLADDIFAPTRHHLELVQQNHRLAQVKIEAAHGDSATFEQRTRLVQLYDPPTHRYDHELFWTGERPLLNLAAMTVQEFDTFIDNLLPNSELRQLLRVLRFSRLRFTLYLQLLRRVAPPRLGALEALEIRTRDPRRLRQLQTQFNSIVKHHSEFHQYARIIILPSLHARPLSGPIGPLYTLGFVPRGRGSRYLPINARPFWNNVMLDGRLSTVQTPRDVNIESLAEYYDENQVLRRRYRESIDVTPGGLAETLKGSLRASLRQTYKYFSHSVDGEWLALLPRRESGDSGASRHRGVRWSPDVLARFRVCGLLATQVIDDRPQMLVAPVRVSRQHKQSVFFRPTLVPPSPSDDDNDYLFHNPNPRHGLMIDVGEHGRVIINLRWAVKISKETFAKCVSRELTSLDNRGWITTMNGLSVSPRRTTKLHDPMRESESRNLERLLDVSLAENTEHVHGAGRGRKYTAVNQLYSLRIPVSCTVMLQGSVAPTNLPVGSAFIDVSFGIVEQLLMPIRSTQWDVEMRRSQGKPVRFAQQLQMHVQGVFISRAVLQPLMHAQPPIDDPHVSQVANDRINMEAGRLGPAMANVAKRWDINGVVPLQSTALFMSKFGQSKSSK